MPDLQESSFDYYGEPQTVRNAVNQGLTKKPPFCYTNTQVQKNHMKMPRQGGVCICRYHREKMAGGNLHGEDAESSP